MTEQLGYGTAFFNKVINEWEGSEAITPTEQEVVDSVREVLQATGVTTEEEFSSFPALYITEVVQTRLLTWEDVKPNDE